MPPSREAQARKAAICYRSLAAGQMLAVGSFAALINNWAPEEVTGSAPPGSMN